MRRAIAIDFDGCLCTDAWPDIGTPNWPVIRAAQAEQQTGTALILWTCRSNELLEAAVAVCAQWGLVFDAVNANLPERLVHYGSESRKISADEYWDDRAVLKVVKNCETCRWYEGVCLKNDSIHHGDFVGAEVVCSKWEGYNDA